MDLDPTLPTACVVFVGLAIYYLVRFRRATERAKAAEARSVHYWDRATVAEGRARVAREKLADAVADRDVLGELLLSVFERSDPSGNVVPIESARRRRTH